MNNVLKMVEIVLAILGIYFIILRIIAHIVYRKIKRKDEDENVFPPKYTLVENCPICGSNTIDIFENFSTNNEGEQVSVGYSIGCIYCGLRSPVLNSMEQCIDYWNTRRGENNQEWIAGEPEVVYKEVEYGKSRKSTSEEINNKSDVI